MLGRFVSSYKNQNLNKQSWIHGVGVKKSTNIVNRLNIYNPRIVYIPKTEDCIIFYHGPFIKPIAFDFKSDYIGPLYKNDPAMTNKGIIVDQLLLNLIQSEYPKDNLGYFYVKDFNQAVFEPRKFNIGNLAIS